MFLPFSPASSPRFLLVLGIIGLLGGCGHALPRLPGFDAKAWRADPYACRDQRRAAVPALVRSKEALYEARADDVTALLGPPDEEELRAGTEKVYYYYLEPGTQCNARHARSEAACISLRFGPLGTVTEVLADPLSPKQP
ncbi:hypothetical protein AUC43_14040 [Hymenobacter sedentarius]|uniref:Lipoprotein SmpA/OmlA domain-containing protein n=1 Tax=Hymenobacter sedentarius TaxID=1411621 RepID=A0A0U4C521_9BACT|nr:hypothetical protein [Hymenobacter sedentarius]ALW86114.1 hypothetical protein AUC43_14040 [Hymenobacter sedentarius]